MDAVGHGLQLLARHAASCVLPTRLTHSTHLQAPAACVALLRAIMPDDVVVAQQPVLWP